jgi:hypothetical protein
MRIAVVGCCQAHGYAHALAHLLPEAEVESVEAVVSRNHDRLEDAAALLRGCDMLFTQDFGAEFGPLATAALPALGPPVHRLPLLAFAGYHPDMVYLTSGGQVQGSPLGAYHSAIIAAAFSLGVAEADVPQLFNRLVYGRLGYLQGFGAARTLLLEMLAGYGLDLAADFEAWHAEGPFMHGINHPRGLALADVMRAAAIRAGLLGEAAPRVRPPFDHLAADTIWPVYPEIAEALGIPGGMLFKRYSHPVGPLGNALYIGLPRLLRESYAMYRALPEAAFREGAVGRVRETLAGMIGR